MTHQIPSGRTTTALLVFAALLTGCAAPQWLENSVLVSAANDRVVMQSRWGLTGITAEINERDAAAIIAALRGSKAGADPAERDGPPPMAAGTVHLDPKICYLNPSDVPRRADGTIARSASARAAFRRMWACPSTGLHVGACPDWEIDHDRPLDTGGCDAPHNMGWMHKEIKRCSREKPNNKDCWERKVYAPVNRGGDPSD